MKNFFNRFSLFTRLVMILGGGTIAILVVIILFNYSIGKKVAFNRTSEKTKILSSWIAENIEQQLQKAQISVQLTATCILEDNITRDSSQFYIQKAMSHNPLIYGMCFLPTPKYLSILDSQAIYSHRDETNSILCSSYRYQTELDYQQDWYVLPFYLQRGVWVEPYLDYDLRVQMITYAYPLILPSGELIGILTCDITTKDLWRLINKPELYGKAKSTVLSRQGVFISHADTEFEMRETVFSLGQSRHLNLDAECYNYLGHTILNSDSGILDYTSKCHQERTWYFYHSIPSLGGAAVVYFTEKELRAEMRDVLHSNVVLAALGILTLLLFTWFSARTIAKPLMTLSTVSKSLLNSNFKSEVPKVKGSLEVMNLRDALEELRRSTQKYIQDVRTATIAQEKLSSELAIARDIQMGIVPKLFPAFPSHPQIDLYAKLQPALEVGGDLYDFLMLDEHHIYIAIGDVSGKGVPASLLMAVGKTLLKSSIMSYRDPAKAVSVTNQEIAAHNDACMFITLFAAILDIRTGELSYTNAGHNPPLIFRDDSKQVDLLTSCHGPAIGVIENLEYKADTVRLFEKDTLLLYTDGITEAMNSDMKIYSEERLSEWFRDHAPQNSATDLILLLYKEINDYANGTPQWDDMTTLAVRGCSQMDRAEAAITFNELHVYNRVEELPEIVSWTESVAQRLAIPAPVISKLHLVIEEWFVNIITHGYPRNELRYIDLRFWRNEDKIYIRFIDDGVSFNPSTFEPIAQSDVVEERAIGGLGIFFIQKTVDEMIYVREKEKNILTMVYCLSSPHETLSVDKYNPDRFKYVSLHQEAHFTVLTMPEQLDINSSGNIQRQLLNLIAHDNLFIKCDFAQTKYISSAGLRVMLMVFKRLRSADGQLVITNLSKDVYEPFILAQFHTFMTLETKN